MRFSHLPQVLCSCAMPMRFKDVFICFLCIICIIYLWMTFSILKVDRSQRSSELVPHLELDVSSCPITRTQCFNVSECLD